MRGTSCIAAVLACSVPVGVAAETVSFDAASRPPTPETGYLRLGASKAPAGTILGANSRFLTDNGRPWLPVMGEFHFARLPSARWDDALGKIKASGVDIVATYLFWDYHEEHEGAFDFSGDRDLRRFLELAQKHGLRVLLRLGPWAHGEVRFGGEPDWVVRQMPTRSNDPQYLSYVERFWGKVAEQTRGLLWKDGGPIIGVQLENEYNLTGPGRGRDHIMALKSIALKLGFDVPFYTVTGWDGTVYPPREVTPVFGGYPDEPWGITGTKLPPKETYGFRFTSRVSGNLGAQTTGGPSGGDADPDIPHTPFLGAEYGAGLPTMYRRRPIVTPDDIASMLPVQLGSGVNLYGYYMFHGGRNLIGDTTLEENSAIGGFNDLPLIDYDFQAPFGEYDQAQPVLGYLRPYHLFLQQWGSVLAPMTVRAPDVQPKAIDDLSTIRTSVRSDGRSAFVFVNNHVREYRMALQRSVRFSVRLTDRIVSFPDQPIDIPSDAYFIWPVGLDLGGARLDWATVQPVTSLQDSKARYLLFSASAGIEPELQISSARSVGSSSGQVRRAGSGWTVSHIKADLDNRITVVTASGEQVILLVVSSALSRQISKVHLAGRDHLLLTDAEVNVTSSGLSLRSVDKPQIDFATLPAIEAMATPNRPVRRLGGGGGFQHYRAVFAPVHKAVSVEKVRAAGEVPPIALGGPAKGPITPYPETFGKAAAWRIALPGNALDGLDEGFLKLEWVGDVARLFSGTRLLDDRFYDGRAWSAGLSEHRLLLNKPLLLTILPLRADSPVYMDDAPRPKLAADTQRAELKSATFVPVYRLDVPMR